MLQIRCLDESSWHSRGTKGVSEGMCRHTREKSALKLSLSAKSFKCQMYSHLDATARLAKQNDMMHGVTI
eukprot:scaffold417550_cov13-Prasinocladus_malaysianus.AAC.1